MNSNRKGSLALWKESIYAAIFGHYHFYCRFLKFLGAYSKHETLSDYDPGSLGYMTPDSGTVTAESTAT